MRREARAEKERIETGAAEDCAGIQREYTQELERIRTEAKQAVERELPMIRDRLVGKAVREGHVEKARIKQEFLERVFEEARRALAALAESAEYPAVLQGLIGEIGEKLTGEVVLEVPERDVKPAEEAVKKAGLDWTVRAGKAATGGFETGGFKNGAAGTGASETGAPKAGSLAAGGLVAETADGLERMDNGLFTRLRRAEQVLSAEVAAILFDGGESGKP